MTMFCSAPFGHGGLAANFPLPGVKPETTITATPMAFGAPAEVRKHACAAMPEPTDLPTPAAVYVRYVASHNR